MTEAEALERYPIAVDPIYFCWIWIGEVDPEGYGKHRGRMAHRHVYQELEGPIEAGKMLDHICRRRGCCNPRHLEAVDQYTNERRKHWRHRVRKMTHCKAGHELKWQGMITPEGGKICRECEKGRLDQ